MQGCKVRKLAVLVVIGALVALVVKKLRGNPAPQFSNHPTVTGGPAADPLLQPVPLAKPAPHDPTVPPPDHTHDLDLVPAPVDPTVPEPEPEPEPEAVAVAEPAPTEVAAESSPADRSDRAWVKPVDGACPDGYPIKAKVKSGIYHEPGGVTYERTKPDRCYPSVEAAEADGLRPPKR